MDKKSVDFYNEIFPTRLREVMDTQNITQAMLAAEIGVSRQSVAKYMSGQAQPNVETLQGITKYLEVSSDYFIGIVDTASLVPDIKNACEYTGLSEEAIEAIAVLKKDGSQQHLEILNMLCKNGFVVEMLNQFSMFLLYHTDGECTFKFDGRSESLDLTAEFAEWQLDKQMSLVVERIKNKLYEDALTCTEGTAEL